jgi:hypothetical protein
MAITLGKGRPPREGNFMLGGDDQRGQEGGGPFGKLIVDFHTHLPPGSQVAAGSNAVPQFDTKETGGQA